MFKSVIRKFGKYLDKMEAENTQALITSFGQRSRAVK